MKIGGLQKISLIDYPGMISAVVFTQGCNFRCGYCHNPELVDPRLYVEALSEDELFAFLEKRRGKIDAVVITGGEPTIQRDLLPFIQHIKELGYLIKIDTNGSLPEMLNRLVELEMIDYIAMDIKGPFEKYTSVTGRRIDIAKIRQSIKLIMSSGIPYEFRTTVVKSLLSPSDIHEIALLIKNARLYYLQQFIPTKTLSRKYRSETNYSFDELALMKAGLSDNIEQVQIR
ncbi:MAG: anaerobic ribonucleoside-triphosphate reductase activating protein [Deltaproteobacteria bacterium]|nr:anaerobic ribonucleoside-triphosphate reductase activating protein [Deltaproteobacteria bacterium]